MQPLTAFAPRLALSDAEVVAFAHRGYHIHPEPLFSPDEVATIRAACERVAHGAYATGTAPDAIYAHPEVPTAVCKLDNAWKSDPAVAAAATSPRIGQVAAQLLGARGIRLFHDQYLRKPGHGGGIVTWHQDWMFWQMIDRCRTATCWIALADVAPDSGPMLFQEGSHHLGLRSDLRPDDWTGDALPPPPVAGFPPLVPVVMRAGQVSFHHGMLMHGSDRNHGAATRYSLVAHVLADDCRFRAGHPHICAERMLDTPDHPAPGETFRGPQFPWLWRDGAF